MSTQTRSSGGGRNKKNTSTAGSGGGGGGSSGTGNSGTESVAHKKSDHAKTDKEKPHVKQPTAEQIRIAEITNMSTGSDDPKMREKVASLMETTQRTEEEVCCALNECDNDMDRAVIFLLETLPVGAFETSSKKKKNRVAGATDATAADGEWNENNNSGNSGANNNSNNNGDSREKSRNRGNTRVGRGNSDSRGWRGRESRENERNAGGAGDNKSNEKWQSQNSRRGLPSSFRNGGFSGGGRGGRTGGRLGPRSSRDQNRSNYFRSQDGNETAVDTWDNTIATNAAEQTKSDDTWGDWDNEEYTGSLADTKVFTPSSVQNQTLSHAEQLSAPPGLEQQILNPPSQLADDLVQQYNSNVVSSTASVVAGNNNNNNTNPVQYSDIHVQPPANASHLRSSLDMPHSSSLSAEQSQYFNSLSSQNSTQQQQQSNLVNTYQPVASVQYTTSPYASNINYAEQVVAGQPQIQSVANRNSKRARVPPPSKIPSSAVEMPDTLSNIGYLDVQFGALDFGSEETFDAMSDKFQTSTIVDNSQTVTSGDVAADYQTKAGVVPQGSSSLQQSQLISNSDSLTSQNENLSTTGYSQRQNSSVVQTQTASSANTLANASAALEQLTKSDHYANQATVNATSVSGNGASTAGSYQTYTNKSATVYQQPSVAPQGYNNSNYANTQVSNSSSYSSGTNTYSSYNQGTVNSYQAQQSSLANNVNNSSSATNVSNSSSTPVGSSSSVNNSSSSTNTGYLSNQYPSSQTSSVYPSQASAYQNNQSVYGNSGLNNNAGYTGNTNTSTAQYSSFSGSKLNKDSTPVTTIYDSTLSSSTQNVAANNSSSSTTGNSSNTMSSPSIGLTNTKVTNSTAKSTGGGNVVSNIPMVSQYIPTGMPFYQQPVYSYEDIQMLQQRIPPHVPGYYDINYQTPTSLGASGVRDGNLGSVAYSTMSDGRFTRTDNNSSPVSNVPSTMSQQTGSGGPMLNLPYAYFYGANMMPSGFQYGTPALYPQQLATNASSNAQFPKPSYNSAYGSTGYDTLGQSAQDYNKSAYPGSGNQQSKGQNVSNPPPSGTASDISSSMYGNKSHAALNKVNSYEKQSFHSGTPPPFNIAGTQTAGATSQAYGAQQLYIQAMPAALHNMNMHQQIHQMDGRVYNSTKRDSNSTGQRQQTNSQGKSGTKQGYSPSYWTAQN